LSKLTTVQKKASGKQFNDSFKVIYSRIFCDNIFNLDETRILYNFVIDTILAYVGGSTTIVIAKMHSRRIMAVLGDSALSKNANLLSEKEGRWGV
jgi:hypothetical protein